MDGFIPIQTKWSLTEDWTDIKGKFNWKAKPGESAKKLLRVRVHNAADIYKIIELEDEIEAYKSKVAEGLSFTLSGRFLCQKPNDVPISAD